MTDEVARPGAAQQLPAIAGDLADGAARARQTGPELGRFMSALEAAGQLNRKVETLARRRRRSAERYAAGKPLTRPEIGVLLSYAKIVLFDALVASHAARRTLFRSTLSDYFPAKMQKSNCSRHRQRTGCTAKSLRPSLANDVDQPRRPGLCGAA